MKKRKLLATMALLTGTGVFFAHGLTSSSAHAWWKPTAWTRSSSQQAATKALPVPDIEGMSGKSVTEHTTLIWYRPEFTLAPVSTVAKDATPRSLGHSFNEQLAPSWLDTASLAVPASGVTAKAQTMVFKEDSLKLTDEKTNLPDLPLPTPRTQPIPTLTPTPIRPNSAASVPSNPFASSGSDSIGVRSTPLSVAPQVTNTQVNQGILPSAPVGDWVPSDDPMEGFDYDDGYYNPGSRVWLNAEFLLWWFKQAKSPALFAVAPGSLAGTGTLPDGAIQPIFGGTGEQPLYPARAGVRASGGFWFSPEQDVGVEGSWFRLRNEEYDYRAYSSGSPLLGPTYFDPVASQQVLVLAAEPNRLRGSVSARLTSQLWGTDANLVLRGDTLFADRFDWLVGIRHVQFHEDMVLKTTGTFLPTVTGLANRTVSATDSFSARNRFYGPQFGCRTDYRFGKWAVNFTNKLAVGAVDQDARIDGSSVLLTGTVPGGILAQPTNIGSHHRTRFGFTQDIALTLNLQLTRGLRSYLGYNVLYMNQIARPTDLVGPVDTQSVPLLRDPASTRIPTLPAVVFSDHEFWAQGISTGFEWRF